MANPIFIKPLPDGSIAVSAGGLFGDRRQASRPLPQSLSARRERTSLALAKLGKNNNNKTN